MTAVAEHRGQPVLPLAQALVHMPDRQPPYAAMVDRMSYRSPPPARWTDLLADVIAFVDALVVDGGGRLSHWDPTLLRWVAVAKDVGKSDPRLSG